MTPTTEPAIRTRRAWPRQLRFAPLAVPAALVVALAGCGDDGGDGSGDAVEIRPTSYVTQPVTETSSTVAQTGPGGSVEEGHIPGTQQYTIRQGEFLSGIAADFDVEMSAICEVNNWDDCAEHPLFPGDEITIPPGARDAAEVAAAEEDEADDESEDTSDEGAEETDDAASSDDAELCPDGSDRGTYTIEAGDFPGRVAENLDVTVQQLNDANANTPGYSSFYEGLDIYLPCPDEEG